MSPIPPASGTVTGLTPQVRVACYYSTLFMVMGAFTGFGGIWFADQGFSESRIGLLSAVPVLVVLLLNLWVGRIADRAGDWKGAIVSLSAISAAGPFGLFLGGGFWWVLLFWSVTLVAYWLTTPIIDAATMRLSRRSGFDYAGTRAWGTVGYIAAIFATGAVVSRYGADAFVPVICLLGSSRAVASLALPRFRATATSRLPRAPNRRGLIDLMQPWFLLPLVGFAMVFATFLILNTFQALLWKQQGIPSGWITFLVALGAIAEAAMFFGFRRFASRFPARHLLLVAAIVAVLRWTAFGFSPGIALLIPLQMLHAVTYALGFMGCVAFIANWTPEEIAAEAQSFFVLLQQFFSVFAVSGFGWLAARYGAQAYFASAVFASIGAMLIFLSLRLKPPAVRH